jgi:hypothetical protein
MRQKEGVLAEIAITVMRSHLENRKERKLIKCLECRNFVNRVNREYSKIEFYQKVYRKPLKKHMVLNNIVLLKEFCWTEEFKFLWLCLWGQSSELGVC